MASRSLRWKSITVCCKITASTFRRSLSRLKPFDEFNLLKHLDEIIVFCFILTFVIDAKVDRIRITRDVSVTQRNQIDSLNRLLVLSRPEVSDQSSFIGVAVRLIHPAVIDTGSSPFQVQFRLDFIRQVFRGILLSYQKTVNAIVTEFFKHLSQTHRTRVLGFCQKEQGVKISIILSS